MTHFAHLLPGSLPLLDPERLSGTLPALVQAVGGSGLSETLAESPALAIATLFGAGVLTSLTPCIYPMIPITVSVITGTARENQTRWRTLGLTLTYVVGMAAVYASLGLLAGLSGSLFGTVSASPWALLGIGNLLLLFSLVMLEVVPMPVPRRLLSWAAGKEGGSYGAVLVLGATSGVVAAPCGAPAFAVVLTWVAASQAGLMGFFYLFAFSLGMTALLVVVGLSSGALSVLPRSGRWLGWMKKAAGILMIAVAQYYFVKAGYNL